MKRGREIQKRNEERKGNQGKNLTQSKRNYGKGVENGATRMSA